MAEVYSLSFHAPGADADAQVANGGADQYVVGKSDWEIFERIDELAALVAAEAAGKFADGGIIQTPRPISSKHHHPHFPLDGITSSTLTRAGLTHLLDPHPSRLNSPP